MNDNENPNQKISGSFLGWLFFVIAFVLWGEIIFISFFIENFSGKNEHIVQVVPFSFIFTLFSILGFKAGKKNIITVFSGEAWGSIGLLLISLSVLMWWFGILFFALFILAIGFLCTLGFPKWRKIVELIPIIGFIVNIF